MNSSLMGIPSTLYWQTETEAHSNFTFPPLEGEFMMSKARFIRVLQNSPRNIEEPVVWQTSSKSTYPQRYKLWTLMWQSANSSTTTNQRQLNSMTSRKFKFIKGRVLNSSFFHIINENVKKCENFFYEEILKSRLSKI